MAQVQYEGIGTLLIDSVDVDVDMNEETGISETTIGTSALGPCLCFMIEFKYYDSSSNSTSQRCFVEHYTYWIDDVNKSSSKILNELLACLSTKLKLELDIISFYLTNTQRPLISDCRLVLAGGDINKTKDIHKAFSLLNSININKEAIIGEDRNLDVIFLLKELLNRVIIFKSTYKGSVGESRRADKNSVSVFLKFCCISKNLVLGLTCFGGLETSLSLIEDDVFVSCPRDSSNIKIGINGFGLIGKLVFRCALEEGIQTVAINDPLISVDFMFYIFKYHPIYVKYKDEVSNKGGQFIVNGRKINIFAEKEPSKIPWGKLDAEYIVESSGKFTTIDKCQLYLHAGAKKVIITAPSSDAPMFVMGVNENNYTGEETIISNASSTINCLAPLAKIIHDKFDIIEGLMISVHSSTHTEKVIAESSHKDWQDGRETAQNIASSTDLATFIGKIIPDLNKKLTEMPFHISTPDVSVVHLIARLRINTTYEEICVAIKEASNGLLKNILSYTGDEVVSTDSIGNTHSSIFDAKRGISIDDNFVRIVSWYDNEYGYSNHVIDLIKYIAKKDYGS